MGVSAWLIGLVIVVAVVATALGIGCLVAVAIRHEGPTVVAPGRRRGRPRLSFRRLMGRCRRVCGQVLTGGRCGVVATDLDVLRELAEADFHFRQSVEGPVSARR